MSGMTIVYTGEEPPASFHASLLLIGPQQSGNWHNDAIRLLRQAEYQGVVFVPEPRSGKPLNIDYVALIAELDQKMEMADVVLAWIDRSLASPGLTSNALLGNMIDSGKVVFGAPEFTWKTRFLRNWAKHLSVPHAYTLEQTVQLALQKLGEGVERQGGERFVPPFVWHTPHFQQWYSALQQAGNRLDYAKLVWSWRVGPQRRLTFFWILYAKVWITAENRYKDNEVVLSRPDISTVVLYKPATDVNDALVVLVKEFRTPGANPTGYVHEVAGGSSWKPGVDPLERASDECDEETGLRIAADRFRPLGARQIAPTLSSHMAHAFAAEITSEEVAWLRRNANVPRGVAKDTEQTYPIVARFGDIRTENLVGWPDMGMIWEALAPR